MKYKPCELKSFYGMHVACPCPILLPMHFRPVYKSRAAERLDKRGALAAGEAKHIDEITITITRKIRDNDVVTRFPMSLQRFDLFSVSCKQLHSSKKHADTPLPITTKSPEQIT